MERFAIQCLVGGAETAGALAVFEEIVAPGAGPPRHTHRHQLEVFHVLAGTLRFEVDGASFERGAGEVAVVPAGAVHAFRNFGDAPARIHFELLPAADSEEAFAKLAAGEVTDVAAFFDRYGMDLAGPPLD